MSPTDQPNSFVRGAMSTLGMLIDALEQTTKMNVMLAITHP